MKKILLILAPLLLSLPSLAEQAVLEIELKNLQVPNKAQIFVGNAGHNFDKIISAQLDLPVEVRALCASDHNLTQAQLTVGKFPLLATGHMANEQTKSSQPITLPNANAKEMSTRSATLHIRVDDLSAATKIDPVKACNDFLQSKQRQGMSSQVFLQQDRRITFDFEISFAAECKRKWKAGGLWTQTTRPANAVIVCRRATR